MRRNSYVDPQVLLLGDAASPADDSFAVFDDPVGVPASPDFVSGLSVFFSSFEPFPPGASVSGAVPPAAPFFA